MKIEKEAQKLRKAKAKAQDSEKKLRVQVSQMQTKISSPKTSPSSSNSKSKTDEEIAKLRGSVQILEESVSVSFASKVDDVVQNTSLLLDEQLQQTQRLWETSSAILKSDIEVQFTNHSTKAQDLARQTFTAAISDMCAQSDKHFEAERKFHALMATTNENHSTKILQMQETHLNQCMADLKRSQESELFNKLSAEIHRANAIRDKTHAAAAAPPSPKVQADYETELKRKLNKNKLKARTRFRELEEKLLLRWRATKSQTKTPPQLFRVQQIFHVRVRWFLRQETQEFSKERCCAPRPAFAKAGNACTPSLGW